MQAFFHTNIYKITIIPDIVFKLKFMFSFVFFLKYGKIML